MNAIATLPVQAPVSTGSRMNALVPNSIADALQLADVMAKASLIPAHLQGKPGDCLLIVMQAQRWGMDAASVAQATSVVHGKLCYEGKLVAAALYAMGAVEGRLKYEFSGTGDNRAVKVTGRPRGAGVDQTVEGTVANWKTGNEQWKKQPDDMLVYRGTRQWARRYAPEALLGVYTPDELEDAPPAQQQDRVVAKVVNTELPLYSESDFEKNLPTWWGIIESGKRTADELISVLQTKSRFTEKQLHEIRNPPKDEEFTADGGEEDEA
ncbi:recombinase RecT [Marilutibacter spongiae]|uniref:Recombinase RecT n=1 Tax=Marilutibacter spongiae TaxID=2025720 RepID=A0A7W3TLA3_9GAMM|nr:recombinase RecT [Lysobacter spongiae]MBB1060383.1 recombinase RecT [Lysobacter spongiae]